MGWLRLTPAPPTSPELVGSGGVDLGECSPEPTNIGKGNGKGPRTDSWSRARPFVWAP